MSGLLLLACVVAFGVSAFIVLVLYGPLPAWRSISVRARAARLWSREPIRIGVATVAATGQSALFQRARAAVASSYEEPVPNAFEVSPMPIPMDEPLFTTPPVFVPPAHDAASRSDALFAVDNNGASFAAAPFVPPPPRPPSPEPRVAPQPPPRREPPPAGSFETPTAHAMPPPPPIRAPKLPPPLPPPPDPTGMTRSRAPRRPAPRHAMAPVVRKRDDLAPLSRARAARGTGSPPRFDDEMDTARTTKAHVVDRTEEAPLFDADELTNVDHDKLS